MTLKLASLPTCLRERTCLPRRQCCPSARERCE